MRNKLNSKYLSFFLAMVIITLCSSPIAMCISSYRADSIVRLWYVVMPIPKGSSFMVWNYTPHHVAKYGYYIFPRAYVNLTYVPSNHTMQISIELVNGTYYSCYIGKCNVTERGVELVYGGKYIVENGGAYSLNGSWEGFFPYLISIDLKKPELKLLFVDLAEAGGCWISNGTIPLLLRLEKLLNMNLTLIPPNTPFWSCHGIVKISSILKNSFSILECSDLSLIVARTDPFAKVKNYVCGNVSIPANELIKAFIIWGKSLLVEAHRRWDNGSVIARGVAVLPGMERLFLLLNRSALPDTFVRLDKEVCNHSLQGLVVTPNFIFRGYLIYHISGFLIYAKIYFGSLDNFSMPLCMFLTPTFDLQMMYCWNSFKPIIGGYGLMLFNSYGVVVKLVKAQGLPHPLSIAPKTTLPIYVYAVPCAVAAVVIATVVLMRVRRVGE